MRASLKLLLKHLTIWLVLICFGTIVSAQEAERTPGTRFELLTMNGSKPALSATGEGITSYRFDELWQRGTASVVLLKPAELDFKIQLPIGYTLFNNLVYGIKTDAVFTGPVDITFQLPSAKTRETFSQLRILYLDWNHADPEVPNWIDATLEKGMRGRSGTQLTESETKDRLPNFETRTLHAFSEEYPMMFVVAVRDPTKLRDKLTADLALSGTAPEQVTEGRSIIYNLKLTNTGPDTATGINLLASHSFEFVSVKPSEGKCRLEGGHVYCTFPSLEKDHSIDIKIVERSEWGVRRLPEQPGPEKQIEIVPKLIEVGATEHDPAIDNNELRLETQLLEDPNKGPVIEVMSPTGSQLFQGPRATVPIRLKATDPDGFVKKLELFEHGERIGEPALQPDGQYEFIYKDVSFGNHWIAIVATDNLGREAKVETLAFFVNGPAKIEITSPKTGSKLNKADGAFTVTIHASAPMKKVSLNLFGSDALPVGNDDYAVKVKSCGRRCPLQAIGFDEHGVETHSEPVELTILEPPKPRLRWFDGEYARDFDPAKPFKVSQLILLPAADHDSMLGGEVTKIEVLANGVLLCTDDSPMLGYAGECLWTPSPGKYKLQVIATDNDGAVGKSDPIEVVIERP